MTQKTFVARLDEMLELIERALAAIEQGGGQPDVTRKPPARSKHEIKRTVISHMRRLAKRPDWIRSYFRHQPFRYAA